MSSDASSSSSAATPIWGAVELGGTTIKIALASGSPTNVITQRSFPTGSDPSAALRTAEKFFDDLPADQQPTALGIGSFGPVDLNRASPTYGFITSTPKPGWQDFDVLSHFSKWVARGVPVGFSTDVNTAAYGEMRYGEHGADVTSAVYITVGTGIGAGIVVEGGSLISGILHPEAGHIPIRRHKSDPESVFKGLCPFHGGDCLEGLGTANAIAARLGISIHDLKSLDDAHPIWEIESYYLAQLCVNLACIVSPHVIILGGGVLKRQSLFPRIRAHFRSMLNGYLRVEKMISKTEEYIKPSRFDAEGSNTSAGCVGTLAFAQKTWEDAQEEKKKQSATAATSTEVKGSKL